MSPQSISVSRRALSIVLFIAWLAHGVPFLLMSSSAINGAAQAFENLAKEQSHSIQVLKDKGLSSVDVNTVGAAAREEFSALRARHLGFTVFGLGASVMAFFALRLWRVAVLITSAIYLWAWSNSGFMTSASFIEGYKLKWAVAEGLNRRLGFFQEDILVPCVLLGTVVYVISDIALGKQRRRTKESEAR